MHLVQRKGAKEKVTQNGHHNDRYEDPKGLFEGGVNKYKGMGEQSYATGGLYTLATSVLETSKMRASKKKKKRRKKRERTC